MVLEGQFPHFPRCGRPGAAAGLCLRLLQVFAIWVTLAGWQQVLAQSVTEDGVNGSGLNEEVTDPQDASWGVGSWIWSPLTYDKQSCRFWRSFQIPESAVVKTAQLRIAVDNGYRLMLDGREIGIGSDWRSVTEYDIRLLLKPGRHILAIEAFNDNREAGLLFGLRIELADGRKILISSGSNWLEVPGDERGWETRQQPSAKWMNAVVVSTFLPRPDQAKAGHWFERVPTMVVKVPMLQPLEVQFWKSGWFQSILIAIVVVGLLAYFRLLARLALQSKAQELLRRERARIARDIHDDLGARLTELALEGEVAKTELPLDSPARSRLSALSEKARSLSGAMDEVVWLVNSRRDTLRDFATYICKHTQRFLDSTAIRCRLDVELNLPDAMFEMPVRRNLLLAVREALNNAVKYSGATEISLRIGIRGQSLTVVVEDNGKGFDLDAVDSLRNGLTNMSERMKEIGGRCQITTSPGAACHVEFVVPFSKSSRRRGHLMERADLSLAGLGRKEGSKQ